MIETKSVVKSHGLRRKVDYSGFIGQRFGRLTVVGVLPRSWRYPPQLRCICSCGVFSNVAVASLKAGTTKSCGCYRRQRSSGEMIGFEIGRLTEPLDQSLRCAWNNMVQRCTNPRDSSYPLYGGRGIAVCERWRRSYANFVADVGPRPQGMSLDRIDNNGGYCPGNVRWSTPAEQTRNRRNNIWVKVGEERMVVADFVRKFGGYPGIVCRRVRQARKDGNTSFSFNGVTVYLDT